MTDSNKPASTKVTTPKFRASYANVFIARAINEGEDPKYSITMLFNKNDPGLKRMKIAAKVARDAKWGNKPPKNLRNPFRDGDEEEDKGDAYKGKIFVYASGKSKPGILDADKIDITSAEEFYSGCYARATINAFAYDTKGNKGISFGLNNLQKLGDGERLDGHTSADDDFDVYEPEDSDTQDGDDDPGF